MQRQQEVSPFQNNFQQQGNLQMGHGNNNSRSQEKNFPQGMRINRLNSLPEAQQNLIQQQQQPPMNLHIPLTPQQHHLTPQ